MSTRIEDQVRGDAKWAMQDGRAVLIIKGPRARAMENAAVTIEEIGPPAMPFVARVGPFYLGCVTAVQAKRHAESLEQYLSSPGWDEPLVEVHK